jgi:hypothetical protein
MTEADADEEHPLFKTEKFIFLENAKTVVTILRCG